MEKTEKIGKMEKYNLVIFLFIAATITTVAIMRTEWFFPSNIYDTDLLMERVFHSVSMNLAISHRWYDIATLLVCLVLGNMLPSIVLILVMVMFVHVICTDIVRKKLKHSSCLADFVIPVILFVPAPLLMLLGINQWKVTPDILYGFFTTGMVYGFASGITIAMFMAGDHASMRDNLWAGLLSSLIMGVVLEGLYYFGLLYLAENGGIEMMPIPGAIGVATGLCTITGALVIVVLVAVGRSFYQSFRFIISLRHKQCCVI